MLNSWHFHVFAISPVVVVVVILPPEAGPPMVGTSMLHGRSRRPQASQDEGATYIFRPHATPAEWRGVLIIAEPGRTIDQEGER